MNILYELAYAFLLFFIYAIFGYICEVVYCFIYNKGKIQDRGFLYGPYVPLYGFGALIIIFVLKRYEYDPIVLFVMAMILMSLLEYITSYLMEKIFENKWWDYSSTRFNINGRICLFNAILFGMLGVFMTYYINPTVTRYLNKIPNIWKLILATMLFIVILFDFIKTTNVALKLRVKLKDLKEEANRYIEPFEKLQENNIKKLDDLTLKMHKKIEVMLDGKKGIKLNKLINKLPSINKINEINILKNHINKFKNNDKKK